MLYKKKRPVIVIIFSYIFYIFATIFIVLGLFQLSNFVYIEYNKDKVNTPTALNELPLQPIEVEKAESNNFIEEEKQKEEEIPVARDPKVESAMKVIENYYISSIDRNIKPHFSAHKGNMCNIVYKVSTNEVTVASCDDYTFKRQVELALEKIKPYSVKTVNGVDLSKEMVYFNYLIKENILK